MWLDQISVMGRNSRPVQAPGKVVFVTEIFTRVGLFAGHQLKSRKSISWKPTITGCTAIPWIFWPGSKCKRINLEECCTRGYNKTYPWTHDREINNLCVLGKTTCYVLAIGGIYSSGLFGVYFQTTDRAEWEVWGDLDKPTGPRTCPQKWTAPRTKF